MVHLHKIHCLHLVLEQVRLLLAKMPLWGRVWIIRDHWMPVHLWKMPDSEQCKMIQTMDRLLTVMILQEAHIVWLEDMITIPMLTRILSRITLITQNVKTYLSFSNNWWMSIHHRHRHQKCNRCHRLLEVDKITSNTTNIVAWMSNKPRDLQILEPMVLQSWRIDHTLNL